MGLTEIIYPHTWYNVDNGHENTESPSCRGQKKQNTDGIYLRRGTTRAQAFDVNRGLNLLYVYCDVATHTIVGDTKTPLLRACNVTGKHGEFVRHTYVQPHYVPVGRREFNSVEIAINNELGVVTHGSNEHR
jgi:hypothetical protein